MTDDFTHGLVETKRHRTAYLEAGPADGPLLIFVHGWPEIGLLWRAQLGHFAAAGWRCIAPDLRGYGGSSIPAEPEAYGLREVVADLVELHRALGGRPAVWVGHDWGAPAVWQLAAAHPKRCRAVVNLNVPYLPAGFSLENLVSLVNRETYPAEEYPFGQWDYQQYYVENAAKAAREFDADVSGFLTLLFRSGSAESIGKPAFTAGIRARGGWFGPEGHPPAVPRDPAILSDDDFATVVAAFEKNGFTGPGNWYLNSDANTVLADGSRRGGRLSVPVLFLHSRFDAVCDTLHSPLAEPMRGACIDLTEVSFDAGHWLAQEKSAEVNQAIEQWLTSVLPGG